MKRYLCIITIFILIIMGLFLKIIAPFFSIGGKLEDSVVSGNILIVDGVYCYDGYKYVGKYNKKKFYVFSQKKFRIGDVVNCNFEIRAPSGQRNYGGFDYAFTLKTKGIDGNIKINKVFEVQHSKSFYYAYCDKIVELRIEINNFFNKNLKKDLASIIIGILIGDKSGMDGRVIEDFQNANLSHLIAVSGAHFIYVVGFLEYICKFLKNKRKSQVFLIIGILFFMRLTQYTPSVVRAGIMTIMAILSSVFKRKSDIYTNLAISSLVLIIKNPYSIFDIGAILSFSGVLGIAYFQDKFKLIYQNYEGRFLWFFDSISITIAANIVIIPIMVYYYNTISFTFIIANLVVAPLLGVLIILGFIAFIFKFKFLIVLLSFILKLFFFLVKFMGKLPFSTVLVCYGSFIFVIAYYFIVYFLIKRKMLLALLTIVVMIIANFNFLPKNKLYINFVDVGQGDCMLIRYNGMNFLIDSGGGISAEDYDVGKNTLLPYLIDRKVYKIDYIIVSHFDADHCRAFLHVMKYIKVKNAIIAKQFKNSRMYSEFLEIANKKKINIIYVKEKDHFKFKDFRIDIYNPNDEAIMENVMNNNAILNMLRFGKINILCTGDLEKIAEDAIITRYSNSNVLKADILKVGHHGSITSTSDDFLKLIMPRMALIGCGKNNKFGHPNQFILNKLSAIGCKIYRTDLNGEISICIDENAIISDNAMIKVDYEKILKGRMVNSRKKN
ncbi:MAG: DNA internalization-related competence protein ComEC/Rec2 [Clostridiales bacterium]|nr:DNA internalization-related competence protein ComEC/Rec2 [Clostridiales bacterium]